MARLTCEHHCFICSRSGQSAQYNASPFSSVYPCFVSSSCCYCFWGNTAPGLQQLVNAPYRYFPLQLHGANLLFGGRCVSVCHVNLVYENISWFIYTLLSLAGLPSFRTSPESLKTGLPLLSMKRGFLLFRKVPRGDSPMSLDSHLCLVMLMTLNPQNFGNDGAIVY